MHSIYKITNIVTNKNYIGQTSKTISERFNAHIKCASNHVNRYLYDSMNHHGTDKFIIELLETTNTKKEADERERYWIEFLNTINPNGYNMTLGGGGGNTLLSYSEIEKQEIYKKQGESRKGQKRSIETRRKISESKTGKPMSEESKKNLSDKMKEQYLSGDRELKLPELKYGTEHHGWVDIDCDNLLRMIKAGYVIKVIATFYKCSHPTIINRIKLYFNKTYTDIRKEYGVTIRLKTLE